MEESENSQKVPLIFPSILAGIESAQEWLKVLDIR